MMCDTLIQMLYIYYYHFKKIFIFLVFDFYGTSI